ncbi:MAG: AraC family transcriptional regulator ligand-binding domain-containing protein [Gammaproteobacteria bacterium]|nr:AraC family transcriptional regulator ligand-binding domain-containing protein [Gammaproteobacteria bacterium]
MTSDTITLPHFYIEQIIQLVKNNQVDTEAWLRTLAFPSIHNESNVTLSWALFRQFLLDAQRYTQEPHIGLLIGERLAVNSHGILSFAAINCSTTRQLFEVVAQFIPLRTDLLTITCRESANSFTVQFLQPRALGDMQAIIMEAILLAIRNIVEFVSMGLSPIEYVALPYATPDDSAFIESMFHCPVHFEQDWCGFQIPVHAIDTPLKMANPQSFNEALNICNQELEKVAHHTSLSAQVRKFILATNNVFPSLDYTARHFHMTPRTLHRRLLEEGTSFKQLLESIRHSLATQYLLSGHMQIQEIAYALGYSDIANFRRAFKRWEGVSPSVFIQHSQT